MGTVSYTHLDVYKRQAQALSAAGIAGYGFLRHRELIPRREHMRMDRTLLRRIAGVSVLTSVQQSIMNFGILMVQSLVNSFGIATMAAFAAGVKIDAFAYSPAQDFATVSYTHLDVYKRQIRSYIGLRSLRFLSHLQTDWQTKYSLVPTAL